MTTAERIRAKCNEIAEFLCEKNKSYGDSALFPKSVFARGDAADLIRVRIDDKLNRIKNQPAAYGEDCVKDLTGYLVLLMIATDMQRATATTAAHTSEEGGRE